MIGNNPNIYNAPGVYNQGGGGGVFTVDLGGGVSQELTFPPYLVPVEYIDFENYTSNVFQMTAPVQFYLENADELFIKIAFDTSKIGSTEYVLSGYPAIGESGSNAYPTLLVQPSKRVKINYGNVGADVTGPNFHTDDYILIDYKNQTKTLLVKDGFGNSQSYTSTNSYNNPYQGFFSLFGLNHQSPPHNFHGKIFYCWIKNGDKVKALFVPARFKDTGNNNPYFVECVKGTIGYNTAKNWSISGISFGHDIDLSDIGNYFQ